MVHEATYLLRPVARQNASHRRAITWSIPQHALTRFIDTSGMKCNKKVTVYAENNILNTMQKNLSWVGGPWMIPTKAWLHVQSDALTSTATTATARTRQPSTRGLFGALPSSPPRWKRKQLAYQRLALVQQLRLGKKILKNMGLYARRL